MKQATVDNARTLDFLKIWKNVFAQNLSYVVERFHEDPGFRPEVVGDAGACQLGTWINLERPSLAHLASFQALDETHHRFHRIAREMATRFLAGDIAGARALDQGVFAEISEEINCAIDRLAGEMTGEGIYLNRFQSASVSVKQTLWDPSLEVGIPSIDSKHHAIATLIDQVMVNHFITSASAETAGFVQAIAGLIKQDIEEERVLLERMIDAPGSREHLLAHQVVVGYLDDLIDNVARGKAVSFHDIGTQLSKWYIEHLVTHDLELERLHARGERVAA